MRIDDMQTTMLVADYDNQIMPIYEDPIYTGGGSNIIEPEIIIPVNNEVATPIGGGSINAEQVEILTQQAGNTSQSGSSTSQSGSSTSQSGTSTVVEPNIDAEPSATTDETKTYVGGGTTPDSNIIVDKPKRNYLMYGLIGVVGVYVIYKVFFNKKSE
jgi:hypothetical protein